MVDGTTTTTTPPVSAFNGGKMNHIFVPNGKFYEPTFSCEAAQRCFEDPTNIGSLKVHGECCLLSHDKTNQEWIFATRYDAGSAKSVLPEDSIPIPNASGGVHPAKYRKHFYCFRPLDKELVVGKGKRKTRTGPDTYGAIAAGVASGAIPNPTSPDCPPYITVEWVGRKHQGNIDNLNVDHGIYIHGSTMVDILPQERTFQAVAELAKRVSIEGLVLLDKVTGEAFKLRFDCFPDSLFAKNCKLPVTDESTDFKFQAIVAVPAAHDETS